MPWFGQYIMITEEPKNEQEKERVIQSAVKELTETLRKGIVNPDLSSAQHIIREERNVFLTPLDWYGENEPEPEPGPLPYLLTVAVKLKGESSATVSADDPGPGTGIHDGLASPERFEGEEG